MTTEQKANLKKKVSRLKNVDSKLANKILDEIIDSGPPVQFDDIGEWWWVTVCIIGPSPNMCRTKSLVIHFRFVIYTCSWADDTYEVLPVWQQIANKIEG